MSASNQKEKEGPPASEPLIVIVGAGLAGLSVALRLLEYGHTNIKILEAKPEPGGRIKSHLLSDGSRIDMGAQWLHGEKENPVYGWLSSMDLIERPEDEEVELEGLFRTQFGDEPPRDVVTKVLELLMDAKNMLYKMSGALEISCKPVDLFRAHVESEMQRNDLLKATNPEWVAAVLRWFELYEMIDNSCEDLSRLSIRAYSEWTDFDEGRMVRLRGGWQSVVNKMVELIGTNRIVFDCCVTKLSYSKQGVVVHYRNSGGGADGQPPIDCAHVIVTFSIGVMKSLESSFFEPPMDEKRRQAFMSVGFGVINKIFLQFDRPYLSEERGLKLLWCSSSPAQEDSPPSDQMSNCAQYNNSSNNPEPPPQLPGWTLFMTGFDLVPGAPNCLLAWVGGDGAKLMEQHSEEEIGRICSDVFRRFVPDKPAPKLISVKRSTWATDPHIRGAYSYESVAALDLVGDPALASGLWEPLVYLDRSTGARKPLVQFAGEASAASMYATAAGAIVSGWREADRLSRWLKSTTKWTCKPTRSAS